MRKLLWLIPILLLLSCSPCPPCDQQSSYRDGQNSILSNLNVESIPDSIYKEIYDMGYRHGQMCPSCDLCIVYPERQAVFDFLETDKTNELEYSLENNCAEFADILIEHAWASGIPAYVCQVDCKEWVDSSGNQESHIIVAFAICEDREVKLLYIEPQNDGEVKDLEVGKQPYICKDAFCEFTNITVTKVRVFR